MRIGAYAFVTIASGMLVSSPTRTPAAIGDIRKLIVAAKNPSEKHDEKAARRAVRLSGNEGERQHQKHVCNSNRKTKDHTHVTRGIANLLYGFSASRSRSRELVRGLEPCGDLSIDVRRLLEA